MTPGPVLRTEGLQSMSGDPGDFQLDLTLDPGEVCVRQTPSAEVATAMARTLLGLQPPAGGRVALFGQDLALQTERALRQLRRATTVVHAREGDGLLPAWSAFDNLALAWLQRRDDPSRDPLHMRQALLDQARRYRIAPELLDEPVARRSRAERLALALWRALLGHPALVVVDGNAMEPHLFPPDFALDRLLADTCAQRPALLVLGVSPTLLPAAWPSTDPVPNDAPIHGPLPHDLAA